MFPEHVHGKAERSKTLRLGVAGAALLFSIIALSGCGSGGSMPGAPSAAPLLVVNPAKVAFSGVAVGSDSTQPITLTNSGAATLVVSAASVTGNGFGLNGLPVPLTLNAGQSAIATVTFAPPAAGAAQGTISIASNGANSPDDIALSGTGVTIRLALSPSGLSFGNVALGHSAVLPVLLESTGTGTVTISKVAVEGASFTITDPALPLTLSPGGDSNLSVTFAPKASSSYTGSLTVISNATDSPAVATLAGSGSAGAAYSVSLNWKPSTSANVTGYNVYRSVNPNSNFDLLTPTPVNGTSYVDTTVLGGTYYYYATAVSKNQESGKSNVVTVSVP
jgi:hypothetical protein